jgi:hypothetical protein
MVLGNGRHRPEGDIRAGSAFAFSLVVGRPGGRACEHPKGATDLPKPPEFWAGFLGALKAVDFRRLGKGARKDCLWRVQIGSP